MTPPSLTRNQALVLEILAGATAPLGAYAILEQLRPRGVRAPAQVYRALDVLRALGLVHRLETMNAFVACRAAHDDTEPVIFVICEQCGRARELSDTVLGDRISHLATEAGFQPHASSVEVRGMCAVCLGCHDGAAADPTRGH